MSAFLWIKPKVANNLGTWNSSTLPSNSTWRKSTVPQISPIIPNYSEEFFTTERQILITMQKICNHFAEPSLFATPHGHPSTNKLHKTQCKMIRLLRKLDATKCQIQLITQSNLKKLLEYPANTFRLSAAVPVCFRPPCKFTTPFD